MVCFSFFARSRSRLPKLVPLLAISPQFRTRVGRRPEPAARSRDSGSDDPNVLRLLALAAGRDVELDPLTLLEGAVPVALDVREVDKHVVAALASDEAVALLIVEPLHGASSHFV